jgi:hypothetical protein
LTDYDHAKEVARYVIYLTSTLGPKLGVSPTCDCGLLERSGTLTLENNLEPLTPEQLKFTTHL